MVKPVFLPEINDNINYKHDVDYKFNDNNRIVESFDIIQIHILPLHCLVIQFQIKNSNERLKMIWVSYPTSHLFQKRIILQG